jgi:hypothetical protein
MFYINIISYTKNLLLEKPMILFAMAKLVLSVGLPFKSIALIP